MDTSDTIPVLIGGEKYDVPKIGTLDVLIRAGDAIDAFNEACRESTSKALRERAAAACGVLAVALRKDHPELGTAIEIQKRVKVELKIVRNGKDEKTGQPRFVYATGNPERDERNQLVDAVHQLLGLWGLEGDDEEGEAKPGTEGQESPAAA